ncbi:MAG: MFS transporter [Candidatus Coatesbacteria bacterium]|nr:MFS transporter [Candidatus Coatesbacteria bacterium]
MFVTGFALFLGAEGYILGILTASAPLAQFFQVFAALKTRDLSSRKNYVLSRALISRLFPILWMVLPFIFSRNTSLIIFLVIYSISNLYQNLATNAWFGWISDLIPKKFRGRFFGIRNRYLSLAGLLIGYIGASFMDLFRKNYSPLLDFLYKAGFKYPQKLHITLSRNYGELWGFALIFLMGGIMGIISWYILRKQPEPRRHLPKAGMSSFEYFAFPFRDANFRRLLYFSIWWFFTALVASPFWMPFMLNTLKFTFLEIQVYGTIATISSILSLKFWGKLIDKFGNKPVMAIAIVMGMINPLYWVIVTPKTFWLIYFEAISSGIMWSAAGLVSTNIILSIAPVKEKDMYIAVMSAALGVAGAISAILSGFMLGLLPKAGLFGLKLYPMQYMFLLCSLARLSAEVPLIFVREKDAKNFREIMRRIFSKKAS